MKLKNTLDLRSGAYKPYLGPLVPEDVLNHKFRTLIPIFKNRNLFYPESSVESNWTIKSQNISWLWDLGSRNYVLVTCVQKFYQAINLEA